MARGRHEHAHDAPRELPRAGREPRHVRARRRATTALVTLASTFVAATVLSSIALGQPAPREPVRLVYKSEGLCPQGDRFFAEVRARTDKIRPTEGDERARTLRVEVEEGATDSRGSLVVIGADGAASSTRYVRAKTCQDVASALALVAALAIDPEARTTPTIDAAPPPAEDAGTPPSAPPTNDASAVPAVSTTTPTNDASIETDAGAPPRRPPPSVSPTTASATYRGWVAFGAEGSSLLEIRPAFAIELGLDIARDSLFSPSISLRASRSFTGEAILPAGTANMTFNAIALEPCPLRVKLGGPLELLPCARLAFGFVDAEATGITAPQSATRGWGDVGAHVKVVWKIAGPLRLSGHGGARFPLFRDRFFVDPNVTLYEAPPAVFAFGGDVGFLFP